jgi:hypothetical protein
VFTKGQPSFLLKSDLKKSLILICFKLEEKEKKKMKQVGSV